MHMRAGLLLAAVAALATADAALTCRFDVQSKLVSTLDTPIVAASTSGSSSGSSDNGKGNGSTKKHNTNSDGSRGTHSPNVGESSAGGSGGGDHTNVNAGSGPGTSPTSTPTPTSKTPAPSKTTATPTPSSTPRTTSAGSGLGPNPLTNATSRHTTTDTTGTRHLMEMSIEAGSSFSSRDGSMGGHTVGSHNNTISTNSTSSADAEFTCDEEFYKQWDTLGLKCGGASIDVKQAVAAAKCVIYSGSLGTIPGSTCVSICAFPACVNNAWSYGANNGMSSEVYNAVGINSFLSSTLKKGLSTRLPNPALLLNGNTSLASTQQCDFAGSASFGACSCSALSSNGTKSVEAIKKDVAKDKEAGVIPKDNTTTAGLIIAPTSQSLASVTIVMSSMAAVASSVVSSTTAASSSVAAVGANAAVVTIEVCQFTVMINQLQLDGKSSALAQFGKSMAFSAFTFLPFGKLDNSTSNSTTPNGTRRLQQAVKRASDSGIAQYSRTLGIREDMLFLVTLAGVVLIMGGLIGAFALVYFASGFFMDREVFYNKFFNKLVGLEVLVAVMCQYTIGVTGTYQIYFSFSNNNPTDPKCILAFVALLGLAIGIMVYGVVVVKKYENEIRDVGTGEHLKKPVCQRYGPLYEEYNYKNRFFFCAKMLVALVTGMATGYVGMRTKYQVSILLATQVVFFFYLEAKRPHHSKFAQTTTSFVTIMKIATLLLTFFLVTATAGLPNELQNGISLAIVGLNMVVLFLLMIRSLYTFWKKYQLQRDARYDQEDQSAAQEYFKDDTPANGVQQRPQEAQDHNQRAQQQDPYAQQQQQQQQQGQPQYQQSQPQYQQNQQVDQYQPQYQPQYQQQYQPQYEQEPSQRQSQPMQQQQQPSQRQLPQQPSARSRYADDVGPTMQADNNQIHLQANNMHQSRTTSNVYADVSDPTVDERYNMRRPDNSRQYVANPNDRYMQGNDVVEL